MYCIKVTCIMKLNTSPYKNGNSMHAFSSLTWSIFKNQTIATNVTVGRWSEKSQNPGRKLHSTKILYLFLNLNFYIKSIYISIYHSSLLWTIRRNAYAAAKVFEEMPTVIIITAYCILDNYTASISLFDKKVFKGQLQCYDKILQNLKNSQY